MSYVCSKCKAIGDMTPFHYSHIEEDRENFDWLCKSCVEVYKTEYHIKFILIDIATIIYPHPANELNTSIFTDAVSGYSSYARPEFGSTIEMSIFDKVFSFLNSLNGSFMHCKYGITKDGIYGISTIGYISKLK